MIKYFKLIIEYLFDKRTFLLLALTALIPSVLIGVYMRPMEELFVFFEINEIRAGTVSFFDMYWRTTGFNNSPVLTFISLFVLLCAITVLVATIDRHMRIGELKFRNPFRRLNENFWVVFPILLVLIIVKEVFDILALLFVYLWISVTTGTTTLILMIASFVVVYGVFCLLMSFCVMWIPHTFNTGLSTPKTFSSSVKLAKGKVLSLTLMIVLPALIISVVNLAGIYFGGVVNMVSSTITYFVLTVYLSVLIYVAYYDAMGIDREDLKKVNIWKKRI